MSGHCPRGISDCDCGAAYCNQRKRKAHMTIDEALAIILGPELADSISLDMGRHWAIVTAMARATTDQNPVAIKTLREHVKSAKP